MPKLEVRLKTVTPMFLAGADNRTPELRAPSFRGGLRFWLRALLGAQLGENLDDLRKRESAVFGSTGGGSPVIVRVSKGIQGQSELRQVKRRVLPHSEDPRKEFERLAWTEGSEFVLTMATRLGQPELPAEAIAALLLFLGLGGVGSRSRRGFGSLHIECVRRTKDLDAHVSWLDSLSLQNGNELYDYLGRILDRSRQMMQVIEGTSYRADSVPTYPVLCEPHTKVLACRHAFGGGDYQQAMLSFWDKLRQPQYVKDERAFGYAKPGQRRASPLLLHIAQTEAGYHLVMTAFRSELGPLGSRGWSVVAEFLEECKQAWDGAYLLGGGDKW